MTAVSSLRCAPENPRTISVGAMDRLKRALEADPDMLKARPLIALPDGTVVAGNMRLRAAQELGWSRIPVVRADLDSERARLWMLRDNQEYGDWEDEGLAALLAELSASGADLELTGFEQSELDRLLLSTVVLGDPDALPDLPVGEPRSKLGEVYELGEHRLMCGDAFEGGISFFENEMVGCVLTDPPYGISHDTDYTKFPRGSSRAAIRTASRKFPLVAGDDQPFNATRLREVFERTSEQFWFGADYYRRTLSDDDRDGSWLVWDRRKEGGADDIIGSGFELIWSKQPHQRRLLRFYLTGAYGVEGANRLHPTQKPTPLLVEILTRWAPEGCVVADPFGGSGSTLIAAEKTGRTCLMTELDPAYCDVIRDRYEAFVGG